MKYTKHKAETELISLLEKIVGERWYDNLSKNERKYLDLLSIYKEIGGNYNLFCEKYVRIINTKEVTETERRLKENVR